MVFKSITLQELGALGGKHIDQHTVVFQCYRAVGDIFRRGIGISPGQYFRHPSHRDLKAARRHKGHLIVRVVGVQLADRTLGKADVYRHQFIRVADNLALDALANLFPGLLFSLEK